MKIVWHDIKDGEPANFGHFLINDAREGVTEGFRYDHGKWGLATFNGQVTEAHPTHWAEMPEGPYFQKEQA